MTVPLINSNPDKIITVYDLFGNKHRRNLKNFKFRIGVYGVLQRGNEILVQRHPKLDTYGLPGGGVEIGETITHALAREFKEETGLRVNKEDLLSVVEDFFTLDGQDAHSIFITYKVRKIGGKILHFGNNDDTAEVKFMDLNDLTEKTTQRVFWEIIKKLKDNASGYKG